MTAIHESAPTDVAVKQAPLSAEQQEWLGRAYAALDEERMRRFGVDIVSIHSPTGFEREASQWMAEQMRALGMDAFYQEMDENTGNAVGYYRGSGGGPQMLLYAPIDTHLDIVDEYDLPWVGPAYRADMLPKGYVDEHGNVIGLGANNPKGMIMAIWGALDAITRAGVPLKGNVVAGFAGGGMPVKAPPNSPTANAGLGSGVSYMLNRGVGADFGIISKPGYAVAWEEVGLCWFKVTIGGGYIGYAGRPHDVPEHKNTILEAARIVPELEAWLLEFSKANTSGLCTPWGAVSTIRGGWPHKPSFQPAATEILMDVRVNPRVSTADVEAQFAAGIATIQARHPDIQLLWEMFGSYPGASTDPEHWIVQSAMRGWEHVEGQTHHARTGTSGQTDASAIRNLGIPLARIGQPQPEHLPQEWALGLGGMGVGHIPHLAKVAKIIIYAVIDSCMRTRAEVGLAD